MDVLFCAGGGALAVLQHVFPIALVGLAAGLAGSGGLATFLRRLYCGVMADAQTGENPLNLTKSKRSRVGFKAGGNGREG